MESLTSSGWKHIAINDGGGLSSHTPTLEKIHEIALQNPQLRAIKRTIHEINEVIFPVASSSVAPESGEKIEEYLWWLAHMTEDAFCNISLYDKAAIRSVLDSYNKLKAALLSQLKRDDQRDENFKTIYSDKFGQ